VRSWNASSLKYHRDASAEVTTHALFALKVQRKVRNGVAGLAAGGASSDRKKSRANSCLTAMPLDGPTSAITLAEDADSTKLRIPATAAQTRIVSAAEFGWIPGNLCDLSNR
jgi:hypothetical protein